MERKKPRGLRRAQQEKAARYARGYGAGEIVVGKQLGEYPPQDLKETGDV